MALPLGELMLEIRTSFYPIRLQAYQRSECDMEVSVLNTTGQPLWLECDAKVPEAISLAPDRQLSAGRTRLGIAIPGGVCKKKVKVYAGAASYPDTFKILVTVFAYGQDGAIAYRQENRSDLRCVKFGEE